MKDCIGALDGTHIRASIAGEKSIRYIGRTCIPSQNVLAICDFDMCFIYASIGPSGAMMIQVCYIMPCEHNIVSFRILQRVNTLLQIIIIYDSLFTLHITSFCHLFQESIIWLMLFILTDQGTLLHIRVKGTMSLISKQVWSQLLKWKSLIKCIPRCVM